MRLTVNGVEHAIESPGLTSLLYVLREEIGITSPKAGCQQGGCGTCTVLVAGEPRRSCLLPVATLDGAEITTVEGLGTPERLAPVQAAFHNRYAAQCGFCTPGMIVAATALIERKGGPVDRDDVLEALGGGGVEPRDRRVVVGRAERLDPERPPDAHVVDVAGAARDVTDAVVARQPSADGFHADAAITASTIFT